MSESILVSIVAPCYNEEETIPEFYRRIASLAQTRPQDSFEFLFVDDGSADRTGDILDGLADLDPRVKVLHLARNCGHQIALTAGLDFCKGDVIVTIDVDLQDPPEIIGDMLKRVEEGYDVIHAQRRKREGETFLKLFTARIFYSLMKRFCDPRLIPDSGDFRAFTRPVCEALRGFREPHRFLRGFFANIGFRQCVIQYDRSSRFAGETKYPIAKMVRLAVNAIFSFSTLPLRVITWGGLLLWALALIYAGKAVYEKFWLGTTVAGWTSLILFQTFYAGLTLVGIGVTGAYLGRVFEQGQARPLYWLRGVRNLGPDDLAPRTDDAREVCLSRNIVRSVRESPLSKRIARRSQTEEQAPSHGTTAEKQDAGPSLPG